LPIIFILPALNAGKTLAGSAMVRALHEHGYKVGGAKLTGISLMRDTALPDHGAGHRGFHRRRHRLFNPETAAQTAHKSSIAIKGVDDVPKPVMA
jgi:dethiobiotin synthetase